MTYRHTDAQIQEYFNNSALNQSAIKVLLKEGMQSFVRKFQMLLTQEELYYEENDSFLVGSAVDYYISQGEEAFKKKYFFSSLQKKPGPKEMSIINQVFDIVSSKVTTTTVIENGETREMVENPIGKIGDYIKEIYDACNANKYYMNRGRPTDKELAKAEKQKEVIAGFEIVDDETAKADITISTSINTEWWNLDSRPKSILATGLAQIYWDELITSVGKQILSDEQKNKVDTIINSFFKHTHTSYLFEENKDIDVIYQMPLYFEVEGVECKILVDMIVADHTNQTITIYDFKTMWSDVLMFKYALRDRRYDIQASFYHWGVNQNLSWIGNYTGWSRIDKYILKGFAFIVESTGNPGVPIIFPMRTDALYIGEWGDENDRYLYYGWRQGLAKYKEWGEAEWNIEKRLEKIPGIVWIGNKLDYELNL